MKNQLFGDLIESIKELPTEVLEEMRMNMNEEQMRKDFEQWISNHYWLMEFDIERNPDNLNEYLEGEVQLAWEVFKASRETLVVELPIIQTYDINGNYEIIYPDDIKEALESQRIKWK